jgi:hypothetical protein
LPKTKLPTQCDLITETVESLKNNWKKACQNFSWLLEEEAVSDFFLSTAFYNKLFAMGIFVLNN